MKLMHHARRLALASFLPLCLGGLGCGGDAEPAAPGPDAVAPAPDVAGPGEPDAAQAGPDTAGPPPAYPIPVAPDDVADMTFLGGPWIMHTTASSVSLAWQTAEEADSRVEWGTDATYGHEATGEPGLMHRVALSELAPATLYHYRACSSDRCTADLTLATAPLPGQAYRFVVYGDSRSDPPQHQAVVDSIIESAPSLVMHTGDIVETGARSEYLSMHFDPVRRLGQHVPVYVAIGNHEWKELENDVQSFRDYLVYPQDAPIPRPGLSYSFRYGDAFFLVMDNTLDGLDLFFPVEGLDTPLWDWLAERASSEAARSARWRFAFFHYPPGSPCQDDWPMVRATRDHVLPLLRDNGFQAMFTGHVHAYERHDYDGFPVIITGGGGAGLEPEEGCGRPSDTLKMWRSVNHHVTVDIGDDSALLQAVDITGEVFDSLLLPAKVRSGRQPQP
ncbi:MAG: metallophosphoesterase family protein [Deltaproteobacteria bacterium]|nr:metallophosphoesterase family protein [Deltaproteobacteria bacterium]